MSQLFTDNYSYSISYSQNIIYYLEEQEKIGRGLWIKRNLFEDKTHLILYNQNKKLDHLKDIDDLEGKILYIYFDDNFWVRSKKSNNRN